MSSFKKMIPLTLKRSIRKSVKGLLNFKDSDELREELRSEFLKKRLQEEREIPKIDLQKKHIARLKVLLDRRELLNEMPRHSVCAEIGVNEGEFSEMILEVTSPTKLHLIDVWGDPGRYHDDLRRKVKDKFDREISAGNVEMNVGLSTEILKTFPNSYFDWVYLDTDHTYRTTKEELSILKNKVKPHGIIAGHDYTIGNWINSFRYGVVEAVHELCVSEDWELLFLTAETHQCRNFAIKKLL